MSNPEITPQMAEKIFKDAQEQLMQPQAAGMLDKIQAFIAGTVSKEDARELVEQAKLLSADLAWNTLDTNGDPNLFVEQLSKGSLKQFIGHFRPSLPTHILPDEAFLRRTLDLIEAANMQERDRNLLVHKVKQGFEKEEVVRAVNALIKGNNSPEIEQRLRAVMEGMRAKLDQPMSANPKPNQDSTHIGPDLVKILQDAGIKPSANTQPKE